MTWLNSPPIPVGQASTNGSLAQDLGQEYWLRGGASATSAVNTLRGYRLMYNNSSGTLAKGDVLIEERTSNVRNGYCNTTTTAGHPDLIGSVPNEFGSNTVAAASYFLVQIAGPGKAKFASTAATIQSTLTGLTLMGTATTAGWAQLVSTDATGIPVFSQLGAYWLAGLLMPTNSAVFSTAGTVGDVQIIYRR